MNSQKTVICKFFPKCSRGDACTFAHGQSELFKAHPCWFFNNGVCNNTAEDCPRRHELVPGIRKPLTLQRPCNNFHTALHCRFGSRCRFDHFELTEQEWSHHYPTTTYPGDGYTTLKPQPQPQPKSKPLLFTDSDFPPLPSSGLQGPVVDLEVYVVQALIRDNLEELVELVPLYYSMVDITLQKKRTLDPHDLVGGPLTEKVVSILYGYDFDAHVENNLVLEV